MIIMLEILFNFILSNMFVRSFFDVMRDYFFVYTRAQVLLYLNALKFLVV